MPDPDALLDQAAGDRAVQPKITSLIGSDRASAEGGMKNNNPGAGAGDGFGLARFGQGGETVRGVEVKVGDPQFTLIWDTDADLDLHVLEPPAGREEGKEIYWEEPEGESTAVSSTSTTPRGSAPRSLLAPGRPRRRLRRSRVRGRPASTSGSSSTGAALAASPSRPTGRSGSSTRAR